MKTDWTERPGVLRTWWLAVLLAVGFCVISGRLVVLQVVQREALRTRAEAHRFHRETIPALRGRIVDRNGELLARNRTIYALVADKYQLRDPQVAAEGLARLKGGAVREWRAWGDEEALREAYREAAAEALHGWAERPAGELAEQMRRPGLGLEALRGGVEESGKAAFRAAWGERSLPGFSLRREQVRFYPNRKLVTHVLGYVDGTQRGMEGIEKTMDEVLRGSPGSRLIERNSLGEEIVAFRRSERAPRHGHQVRLTIDLGLHWRLEPILERAMQETGAAGISVIFMEPDTGEILVMANRPDFDLETRVGDRRNRAVADLYEPGSTLKLVTMGAALDRGVVGPGSPVFCHFGHYRSGDLEIRDGRPYDRLSAAEVLAKSSNIGIFQIARQLPEGELYRYLRAFGFGERAGIWLTSEGAGSILDPATWSATTLSRVAMGYGVSVTALQMVTAMSAVANGGELLRPRIVAEIDAPEGESLRIVPREFRRRVMSREAAVELGGMLERVVAEGTGMRGGIPGLRVAGKTGTARKYSGEAGGYLEGRYVVSFTGFFPAEAPRVAGIVVIDDPRVAVNERYGGELAAPVFAEMGLEIAHHLMLGDGSEPLLRSLVPTSGNAP